MFPLHIIKTPKATYDYNLNGSDILYDFNA